MNVIAEIKNRLKNYPQLSVTNENNTITILASSSDGFDVWCCDSENEYIVGFEDWHEHFEKSKAEEALNYFAFGLSNECRLKVTSRGGQNYKWTVEGLEEGKWVVYSTTGSFWAKYWCKPVIKYLSNDILRAENT